MQSNPDPYERVNQTPQKRRGQQLSEATSDEIIRLFRDEKMFKNQISHKIGVSLGVIRRVLRKAGIDE